MSAAAAPRSKGASTKSTGGGHIGMLPIKAKGGGKLGSSVASGLSGVLALCFCLVCVRWCRRRRFYKKVQRTMDEEELAFQKSLAKNYTEEMAELDDGERERLKLLENYMETMGASLGADEEGAHDPADLENVEAFLDQLSKAAAGADDEHDANAGGDVEQGEGASSGHRGGGLSAAVEWKEERR